MKKLLSVLLILVTVFALVSCQKYTSSYSATLMVRTSVNDKCSVRFGTLEGRVVLNTKKTSETETSSIHYTASLEEGTLNVSYAVGDEDAVKLFTITGGETLDSYGGEVPVGEKIYIIVETDGKAKGGDIKIDFKGGGNLI